MFKKQIYVVLVFGLTVFALSCSASKPIQEENKISDNDFPTEEVLVPPAETQSELQTDPVPTGEIEQPVPVETASAEKTPSAELTPEAAPTQTPVPQAEPPVQASHIDYTVQSGDTLMKIAFETYGDLYQWKKIYEDNQDRIQNPNHISPALVLKLEKRSDSVAIERNGEKYLIKWGDTLGIISEDVYGTKSKWKKIWHNNKQLIHDPNQIFAGFYLYYTMTAEERDAAEKLKQNIQKPAPLAKVQEAQEYTAPSMPTATVPTLSSLSGETKREPANQSTSVQSAPTTEAAKSVQ